jgi:S-adenosylmethionine hydrolase
MPILTLTTDWGLRDHYVAAFKGELISRCNNIQLVDISHQIEHFDILQASFVIKNCFEKFPKGTLHFIGLAGVHSQNNRNETRNYLVLKCRDHFFIGEDNGIFSLILGDEKKEMVKLSVTDHPSLSDVHNMFLDSIAAFMKGDKIETIGTSVDEIIQSYHTQPTVDQSSIRGSVIYIDSFDNIISNITSDLFEKVGSGRPFTIFLRKSEYDINKINKNYFDTEAGEIVALFNREGFLKLAINHGKASSLLGMKLMDTIRIEFT